VRLALQGCGGVDVATGSPLRAVPVDLGDRTTAGGQELPVDTGLFLIGGSG
jgi:hypothetical protein